MRIDVDKMLKDAEDAVHQPPGVKAPKRRTEGEVRPRKKIKLEEVEAPPVQIRPAPTETIHLSPRTPEPPAIPEPTVVGPSEGVVSNNVANVEPKSAAPLDPTRPKRPYTKRKSIIKMAAPDYPCLFCPSPDPTDRIVVQDPSNEIMKKWKGQGPIMAHIRCAQATPEINIVDSIVDGKTDTVVSGVDAIAKDRWRLVSVTTGRSDNRNVKSAATRCSLRVASRFNVQKENVPKRITTHAPSRTNESSVIYGRFKSGWRTRARWPRARNRKGTTRRI